MVAAPNFLKIEGAKDEEGRGRAGRKEASG